MRQTDEYVVLPRSHCATAGAESRGPRSKRVSGRAILASSAPVVLPGPLAIPRAYPSLAEIEKRFTNTIRFQKALRTVSTYGDALKRWNQFLAAAGIDPYAETAEVLPDDVLEHVFQWMGRSGYARATIETY